MSKRLVWMLTLFVAAAPLCASGAAAQTKVGAEVASLIERLGDGDEEKAMRAAHALAGMGPRVIPALAESLKRRRGCQFQFVASGVIYAIDKDEAAANPVLADVASGRCEGSSENDRNVRRMAAFALVTRAEGIPHVARMLRAGETFARRTAAFAFDELTEKMNGARPDSVEVTPEMLSAVRAALPLLAGALADRDEVVCVMSREALEQAQGAPSAELRAEAARLLKASPPRCPN
jgi:hypothetical protein